MLKTDDDIASQSRVIGGANLPPLPPPTFPPYTRLQMFASLLSYILANFKRITFKLENPTNIKALFSVVSTDFFNFSMSKIEKTVKGSIHTDIEDIMKHFFVA